MKEQSENYGVRHKNKRRSSVAYKKKQIILHIENMSGYDFRTFVERLKGNSADAIKILRDVLDLLEISDNFIHNHFKNLWLADLKRKPKMTDWEKLTERISSLNPDERRDVFVAYAKGGMRSGWVDEFKLMRSHESKLIETYSYLPNNKAVSLARGAIWDLFLDKI